MNTTEIIENIKLKWLESGRKNLVIEMNDLITSGSTSIEIIGLVGSFLKKIKRENSDAYNDATEAIDMFIEYWRNINR